MDLIKQYRQKIEKELENICNDVLHLLDDPLIPNSKNPEAKVFFLKMKGDYYRYLGEFLSGDKYDFIMCDQSIIGERLLFKVHRTLTRSLLRRPNY